VLGALEEEAGKDGVMLEAEFIKRLACPACKTALSQEQEKLCCAQCGRRYPIRDGVPILLLEEAETKTEN
jgi:uncharacterized protein